MADVTLYHNPRCSKSRRALELMRAGGVEPQIVEYLKTPLDRDGLVELLRALQMPARDLLRRGEDEYSELGLADRLDDEEALVDVLAEHPILMERPIAVRGTRARLGRPPERVLELL